MKLNKVAFAVASALAIAAGSAYAGQIDSSSATLAIEVIKNNTQIVRAPSKSYSFAGSINAQTNEQRLQLQYTLSKGTWAVGSTAPIFAALDTVTSISTGTGVVGGAADKLLKVSYTDQLNAPKDAFPDKTDVKAFVTNAGKTLVLNVTIPAAAGNLLNNPVFTINANAIASGAMTNAGINNLYDVAGPTACFAPDSNVDINFKHFSNHFGNNTVLSAASSDSEHQRGGSTNDARLLNFTQNLVFKFNPANAASRTDAASLNQLLAVPSNFAGTTVVQPVIAAAVANTRHYIGSVKLNVRSNGLDLNYTNTYGKPAGTTYLAGDFDVTPSNTGNLDTGVIEANDLTIKLTAPVAWPTGTVLRLVNAAGGATGVADVITTAGQTDFVFKATAAADMALLANGAFLFADFPGNALIPQTTSLAATATLTKDTVAGATDLREQDNMCSSTLTGIGGGIKIDVRNYATHATFGNSGPATTVRIINNSESTPADVYGQLIYADGTYGAWGKLADLKPREVVNMSNKDVEALLVNAPAATNPFGASTAYTVTSGTAIKGSTKAGISDRLRIVSNSGSTLRVQSYMVVGNTVIDTSNAQGVDFENSGDRVPVGANDAQPVSQDAINGLSK